MPCVEVFPVSDTEWKWKQMSKNEVFVLKAKVLYSPHIQGLFCFDICTCTNKGKTEVNKIKWQNKHAKFLFISLVFNKLINAHRNYMSYKVRRLVTKDDFHSKQWLTWSTSNYLCVETRQKFGFSGNRMKFCISCYTFETTNLNQIVNVSFSSVSSAVSRMDDNALISCAPTCRVTPL